MRTFKLLSLFVGIFLAVLGLSAWIITFGWWCIPLAILGFVPAMYWHFYGWRQSC
jgi:hypothetical protein